MVGIFGKKTARVNEISLSSNVLQSLEVSRSVKDRIRVSSVLLDDLICVYKSEPLKVFLSTAFLVVFDQLHSI